MEQSQWFANVVHAHDSQLKAYLRGVFRSVRHVDDVVRESYFRIWEARTVHPIESAKAFLFTIARRLALKQALKIRAAPSTEGDRPTSQGNAQPFKSPRKR